jgi:muramoyltetrapeptide carboxypeptidase LdcA involved in peptidoglycan recycling
MIPNKISHGDEIRVIAPSRSLKIISKETIEIATKRLNDLGFKVTFGKNVFESDENFSSSVESRLYDLHEAFADKNVKGILTVIGGYNSNQLLDLIDYDLIKNNPKIICGYSDITALLTAINTKTNLVTYLGPHFSSFGMKHGFEYTLEYFKNILLNSGTFEIKSSPNWSDDLWFLDQEKREFFDNPGMFSINEGQAEGELVGGNISTFSLLQGTKYFPDLTGKILMLEAHSEVKDVHFDRLLQSLIQQPNFSEVKGIIIGMFQKDSQISNEKITKIIKSKPELDGIPVISGFNFGHITPIATLPVGGTVKISTQNRPYILII